MVLWNSAQFSSSLESLYRGTQSFLDSAGQDKNLIEVRKLFRILLSQEYGPVELCSVLFQPGKSLQRNSELS
jgi:hypothetical protein